MVDVRGTRSGLAQGVMAAAIVLGVVVLGACYQPRLPECTIACGTDGFCPGELTCAVGNLCGPSALACGDADPDAGTDGGTTGAWAALSVGSYHACAIDADRALWCWGNNDFRQLGRTTPQRVGTPSRVDPTGPSDWALVSAGHRHTCGIREDGTLWCWGSNDDRQCGVSAGNYVAPAAVVDPPAITGERWTAVTTGTFFTCALRNDGTLWCFGASLSGQLGQGTEAGVSAAPLRVGSGADWRSIDAGLYHTCGIHGATAALGQLACWGYDPGEGRIGDGGTDSRFAPTPVTSTSRGWRALSVGDYNACALDVAGAVYCWGESNHNPGNEPALVPTRYGTVTELSAVTVGGFGGCYVVAGALQCWGSNDHGELGRPPLDGAVDPVPIAGLGTIVAAGAGYEFVCTLDAAGDIACWGDTGHGQLGDGVVSDHREPVEVLGGHHPWRQVDLGYHHTCAVTRANELYCWGRNTSGEAGSADPAHAPFVATPVRVGDGIPWSQVGAGASHSCGFSTGNAAYCWGVNNLGQRGGGPAASSPMPTLVDAVGITSLSVGGDASCAIRQTTGARRCWGDNLATQLGNNVAGGAPVSPPADNSFGAAIWIQVAMGTSFGCGIGASAILFCWGTNTSGQTARPPAENPVVIPVQVADPTVSIQDDWIAIAAGDDHACGVLSPGSGAGGLYCWGHNGSAQLGDDAASSHVPRQVGTAIDWVTVGVGSEHTCGVHDDGRMSCFGYNANGQLGDGTPDAHNATGAGVIGAADWVAVAAGTHTTCGIRGTEFRLFCWGENRYGQLGVGESVRWTPAVVLRP